MFFDKNSAENLFYISVFKGEAKQALALWQTLGDDQKIKLKYQKLFFDIQQHFIGRDNGWRELLHKFMQYPIAYHQLNLWLFSAEQSTNVHDSYFQYLVSLQHEHTNHCLEFLKWKLSNFYDEEFCQPDELSDKEVGYESYLYGYFVLHHFTKSIKAGRADGLTLKIMQENIDFLLFFPKIKSKTQQSPELLSKFKIKQIKNIFDIFSDDAFLRVMKVNNYQLFYLALAEKNHELAQWIWQVSSYEDQILMYKARGFDALQLVLEIGDFSTLQWLVSICPNEHRTELSNPSDFWLLELACENGHIEIIDWLVKTYPKDKFDEMVQCSMFEYFKQAFKKGDLEVLKNLWSACPDKLQDKMLSSGEDTFSFCAEYLDIDLYQWTWSVCSEPMKKRLFNVEFLSDLIGCSMDEGTLSTANLSMIDWLRKKGHYNRQEYHLAFNEMQPTYLLRFLYFAYQKSMSELVDLLMSFPVILSALRNMDYDNEDIGVEDVSCEDLCDLAMDLLEESSGAFLNDMTQMSHRMQDEDESFGLTDRIYDKKSYLYGYFVLFHLIRNVTLEDAPDASSDLYMQIRQLLDIPGIRAIVERGAGSTDYRDVILAPRKNYLYFLARACDNTSLCESLLQIPAIQQASEDMIDEQDLAQDTESSMVPLSLAEEAILLEINKAYQKQLRDKGTLAIVDTFRNYLKQAFYQQHHQTVRTVYWPLKDKILELPLERGELQSSLERWGINSSNPSQIKDRIFQTYMANPYHSAYRYLSKPNDWISDKAEFVVKDDGGKPICTEFEKFIDLIATLWLAVSDEAQKPSKNQGSVSDRQFLFVQQVALINRAHNWSTPESCDEQMQAEQDDGDFDRPSCIPGTKRRLLQSLLNHPLYRPINKGIVFRYVYEALREYYRSKLKDLSVGLLTDIAKQVDEYICSLEDEIKKSSEFEWLKFPEEQKELILEKVIQHFGEAGLKPYMDEIESKLTDEDSSVFMNHMGENNANLQQLLTDILNQKARQEGRRQREDDLIDDRPSQFRRFF